MKQYEHIQGTLSSIWTVQHNLNSDSIVTDVIVNYGGAQVTFPFQIEAVDTNSLKLTFSSSFSGRCRVVGPVV